MACVPAYPISYGFCPHASSFIWLVSPCIQQIQQRIPIFLNPLSRVEKSKSTTKSDNVWMTNPDISKSDDIAKLCPAFYPTINQYGSTSCRSSFSRVNPDTIGCVKTGEFDLNMACVDGEIFQSKKQKVADSKLYMCAYM